MTSPVIGTPWKKLDRPVTDDALEGIENTGAQPTTCPLVRFTFAAIRL